MHLRKKSLYNLNMHAQYVHSFSQFIDTYVHIFFIAAVQTCSSDHITTSLQMHILGTSVYHIQHISSDKKEKRKPLYFNIYDFKKSLYMYAPRNVWRISNNRGAALFHPTLPVQPLQLQPTATVMNCLLTDILNIVYQSLQQGIFPQFFKTARFDPAEEK